MDPCFHSITNPIIRIEKRKKHEIVQLKILISFINMGVGNSKVISISKIKNISLIEKKWIENLTRGFEKGSNPHSKEEDFSRSNFLCKLIVGIIIIAIFITITIVKMKIKDKIIILSQDFLGGS